MIVQVDFYKLSGKWYSGGTVDVGDADLWKGNSLEHAIYNNQRILHKDLSPDYFVVINNINEDDEFCMCLIKATDLIERAKCYEP